MRSYRLDRFLSFTGESGVRLRVSRPGRHSDKGETKGRGKCLDPAVARVPDGSRGPVFEAMLAHIQRSAHEVSPVKMD